ncbi:hypothetical protein LJC68_05075 [Bacteroidales bacterium OttesenSCG-928-B11]|nr:hypothetical protein [Bacteroidales bacterium OttesenSCG-928-C03]MDL2312229.1 hypothetical protein [Bacteroidales bacterium OttesenSCG-928-B11]
MKDKTTVLLLFIAVIFTACKEPVPPPEKPVENAAAKGVYVLNEGLYDMNNSTITYYDFATGEITKDVFTKVNGRGLGDTGNDLQAYGSKMYAVVNISEQIEVMNISDCKSIKRIPLIGKQPRKIAFAAGKAYVCCFDGSVVRIDTATLEIDATAMAGRNPEGIAVANNKLYVANSGGLDNPNYDKTISVFDLATFTLIKNIEVEINPYIVRADGEGDLYVISRGNYSSVPYHFQRIDSEIDEMVHDYDLPVLNLAVEGEKAYLYSYDFSTNESWIKVMDVLTEEIINENFIAGDTEIKTPYAIGVNSINGDVYISDSYRFTVSGEVYCFDKNGKKKFDFEAGLNPTAFVFKY